MFILRFWRFFTKDSLALLRLTLRSQDASQFATRISRLSPVFQTSSFLNLGLWLCSYVFYVQDFPQIYICHKLAFYNKNTEITFFRGRKRSRSKESDFKAGRTILIYAVRQAKRRFFCLNLERQRLLDLCVFYCSNFWSHRRIHISLRPIIRFVRKR